MKAEELT